MKTYILLLFFVIHTSYLFAQLGIDDEQYKCGIPTKSDSAFTFKSKGTGWGYTYDSLLTDIHKWKQYPFVTIDSIGSSILNRTIWMLQITELPIAKSSKIHIVMHARTHPGEVQAEHVVNEIIQILLDTTSLAKLLRSNCIFTIIPMINPDGVELGNLRENANGVDIESNWSNTSPEKEVLVLKNLYTQLMNSAMPINIALNMHSAYDCKRYFVVHDAVGTNANYFESEKKFVTAIRNYFPEGIQTWDYNVTWKTSTPTYYPESFFWLNYADNVIALTYEDMNCSAAGDYAKTANAFLNGIADYVGLKSYDLINEVAEKISFSIYPNPTNQSLVVSIQSLVNTKNKLEITNALGQIVYTNYYGLTTTIEVSTLPIGLYQVRLNNMAVKLMIVR